MAAANPFPQDALETNRAGKLVESQYAWLRALARNSRSGSMSLAAAAAVLGFILLFLANKGGATRLLAGVALLIVAGFLLVRGLTGADPLDADLRSGYVESVEGAIAKHAVTTHARSSSTTTHYIDVEGKRMQAFRDQYEAAPIAGYVRVYYLPHSMRVVNLERLPDKPLPPGALDSPQQAVKAALGGMLTLDPIARAEAAAQLASIGDAVKAKVEGAQVPASGPHDPRPLGEAILGTWSNSLLTVSFRPDGTATVVLPGNHERTGKWLVDAGGRLVSDATGHQDAADAYVTADQLTITADGTSLTFTRQ